MKACLSWAKVDAATSPRGLTQFYRASGEFAFEHGGDFFRGLLPLLDLSGGRFVSIDSRVHMLMPSWYPCIPGWYCDDFHRPEGQPALESLLPIKHYCVVLGAEVSTTEFLWQPVDLASPTEIYEVYGSDRPLYAHYNEIIERGNFIPQRFDLRKLPVLIKPRNRFPLKFPRITSLLNCRVVKFCAERKVRIKSLFLPFRGINAVAECLYQRGPILTFRFSEGNT